MQEGFKALGVSAAVERRSRPAASSSRFVSSLSSSRTHSPDVTSSRSPPTGSGKTLAFGIPLVERTPADGKTPVVARARADPRARAPGRRGDRQPLAAAQGDPRRGRLRRRARRSAGEAPAGAQIVVATPGRLFRISSSGGSSRSTPSGCSSSTRPTGCSTWASARRSSGSCAASRTTGRRCSSPPRSTARSASSPRRTRGIPARFENGHEQSRQTTASIEHDFVAGHRRRQDRPARRAARRRAGAVARLRAHEAWRGPPRAEARPPRRRRRRHARRHVAVAARARARTASAPAR